MEIRPDNASCVLVGALNRAILRPEWLVQQGLLPEGQEIGTEILITPGPNLYRFSAEGLVWRTEPGRLVIEKQDPSSPADPGEKVAEVLRILEHTPVTGLGNNFDFVPDNDAGTRLLELLESQLSSRLGQWYSDGHIGSTTFVTPGEDSRLQMTLEADDARLLLVRMNFHRDVGDSQLAGRAARRWHDDSEAAERVVDHLRELLS